MEMKLKNIKKSEVLRLRDEVQYQEGQIVSKTLAQNEFVSLTLFAFEKGEEISTHDSAGDAMVQVLEGTGRFTVGGEEHLVHAGEALVMPAGPRSIYRWLGTARQVFAEEHGLRTREP